MNKEKALKNQGLEFREDINIKGGEGDYYIIRLFQCADMHNPALSSTTIYLWLISLTASKELSILLLKLLKCMEQSVYRLIHLGLRVRYRD